MTNFVERTTGRIKRDMRERRITYRTQRLLDVGCELLNGQDHECLTIVQLTKEAGVSVGAFYSRFESKDAFLYRIVYMRLGRAGGLCRDDLHPVRCQGLAPGRIVQAIVEHIIYTLNSSCRGPVRTAWKCGQLDPKFLEPLLTYRSMVADQAVALLKPHLKVKEPDFQIRAAVQIIMATVIDAEFQDLGPLRPGRRHLAEALVHTTILLLGIQGRGARLADDEDVSSDPMIMPPARVAVAATISGLAVTATDNRQERAAASAPKPPPKPQPVKAPAPPARPKRRIHFL